MDIVRDQRRSSYRFLKIPTFSAVALLLLGHNVYHECVAFHIASITRVRPMSYSGAAVVMSGGRSVQVCTNVSCKKVCMCHVRARHYLVQCPYELLSVALDFRLTSFIWYPTSGKLAALMLGLQARTV